MNKNICMIALLGFAIIARLRGADTDLIDGHKPEERGHALLRYISEQRPKNETDPKQAVPYYAARIVLGTDVDYALTELAAAASHTLEAGRKSIASGKPFLVPFDKAALVHAYFLGKSRIPLSTAWMIRDYVALYDDHKELKGYSRGAWNYKLMQDASGYLAAQEWPDLVDRSGLNAEQIRDATGKRLFDDFHDISTRNYSEYGATIYGGVNLCAIRMLVDFAKDPEMRKRATMTLDAMFLAIACTWNQGYNVGTASRAKYWASTDTGPDDMASAATCAWIWFGAYRPIRASNTGFIHAVLMAVPGRYQIPQPIVDLALRRSVPFLTRSHIACLGDVFRMTWHTPKYSLCSQWDPQGSPTSGIYKESRRNMLKWLSDKPSSTFSVCMENPYRPYSLGEKRSNTLGYGENGFSQYMQHQGTLLGLYSVPETITVGKHVYEYAYHKLYAPFPNTGSIVKRIERDGWVICHNGSMLMAFHSVKPVKWGEKWSGNDMLWCDARRNGWILETSPLEPFAGGGVDAELERFAAALNQKTVIDASALDQDIPKLTYKNLTGALMEFRWMPHGAQYSDQLKVDGALLVFSKVMLQENPWVHQDVDGPLLIREGNLQAKPGDNVFTWDFGKWTKTESAH
jgi:hypothetical protein